VPSAGRPAAANCSRNSFDFGLSGISILLRVFERRR
jgi:hypothetical protein